MHEEEADGGAVPAAAAAAVARQAGFFAPPPPLQAPWRAPPAFLGTLFERLEGDIKRAAAGEESAERGAQEARCLHAPRASYPPDGRGARFCRRTDVANSGWSGWQYCAGGVLHALAV